MVSSCLVKVRILDLDLDIVTCAEKNFLFLPLEVWEDFPQGSDLRLRNLDLTMELDIII